MIECARRHYDAEAVAGRKPPQFDLPKIRKSISKMWLSRWLRFYGIVPRPAITYEGQKRKSIARSQNRLTYDCGLRKGKRGG